MLHDDSRPQIDDAARRIIRRKARQFVTRIGLARQEQEDLEQELTRRLLMSLPAFDPGQGHWNVFVTTVVERSAEKLLRRHRAEKRDCRRVCSLDALVEADDDPAGLGDTVRPREQVARRANGSRDPQELAALALDVAEVLARLPAPLREVAELLMTLSVSEAARALGVPRTTLVRWVERLRQCFEDAGMRNYL